MTESQGWSLPKMPDVGGRPQDFYVVDARTGESWNVKTGRPVTWHKDTIRLAEAEILREIAGQTDVILSPKKGMTVQDAVSAFNDVLAALTSDLLKNAAAKDPT